MSNKILVTYATCTGSTVGVAEAIGKTLADGGAQVDVLPMQAVKDLAPYQAVVAGSAIQGKRWPVCQPAPFTRRQPAMCGTGQRSAPGRAAWRPSFSKPDERKTNHQPACSQRDAEIIHHSLSSQTSRDQGRGHSRAGMRAGAGKVQVVVASVAVMGPQVTQLHQVVA